MNRADMPWGIHRVLHTKCCSKSGIHSRKVNNLFLTFFYCFKVVITHNFKEFEWNVFYANVSILLSLLFFLYFILNNWTVNFHLRLVFYLCWPIAWPGIYQYKAMQLPLAIFINICCWFHGACCLLCFKSKDFVNLHPVNAETNSDRILFVNIPCLL